MQNSELLRIHGNENCIVCFGGNASRLGGIPPFEFFNYLSQTYNNSYDMIFYIDPDQWWYQKGIRGIADNIPDTASYIKKKIMGYKHVIFMGVSAGGYAAILFGSILNVSNVIAFIPQTDLSNVDFPQIKEFTDSSYSDLKSVINSSTIYNLYGDSNQKSGIHSIYHVNRLSEYPNVIITRMENFNMKNFRDNGKIKQVIDSTFLKH